MSTAYHKLIGEKGEEMALDYLREKGYLILETNWTHNHLEVDIIAQDEEMLVFVEVKTRAVDYYGYPEEGVSKTKENNLVRAAQIYINKLEWAGEARFDVIAVLEGKEPQHFVDAFYPGW